MSALHRCMGLRRGPRVLFLTALAAAIALLGPTRSEAAVNPAAPSGLRGSEAAAPAPAAASPPAPDSQPAAMDSSGPPPALAADPAPRFSLDPAPRAHGLSPAPGGAKCRQACAEDRYVCRAAQEPDICDPVWSRCVAGCPDSSPDEL